jgi:DNA-binding transcriptional MerR regulator
LKRASRQAESVEVRFTPVHHPDREEFMKDMAIGEVARRAGIAPSAIRYYERASLLPKPARQSGRRRYDPDILGRLEIIRIARAAGFTIAETRTFPLAQRHPRAGRRLRRAR